MIAVCALKPTAPTWGSKRQHVRFRHPCPGHCLLLICMLRLPGRNTQSSHDISPLARPASLSFPLRVSGIARPSYYIHVGGVQTVLIVAVLRLRLSCFACVASRSSFEGTITEKRRQD
ncbi:hypothetical protein K402DRAFT_3492 [Aulographum hederae CBS 113979]|uniref:Uncharacterized protein n=1 Tax=Aulographum hederae CBS 113979 TaxID=1176131 RepID=A0A6G1HGX4_9PEZI|nr:hypothetical protein K402DRAFT_3492 [Aulographum hederae CBS 113979]